MDDMNKKFNDLTNTADHTSEMDANDVQANKVMAILSYLGFLVLIPIFGAKDSRFARFHANQGLILWICGFVINIVFGLLGKIDLLATVFGLLRSLVSIIILILVVYGIVNAAGGKAKELPLIGGFKLLNY